VVEGGWPQEEIPGDAFLFLRIHQNWLSKDGSVVPGFFKNIPPDGGMSCDWNKYSTSEEARQRAKEPAQNGVLTILASGIRSLPDQRLEHAPIPTNRAHSEVFGEKTTEVRLKLTRLSSWAIAVAPKS
jgi:hypothetical protein